MIKKILVAINGSDLSNRAFELALEMADRYLAELTVVSVVPKSKILPIISTPFGPSPPLHIGNLHEDMAEYHEKILKNALQEAKKKYPRLTVIAKIIDGDPADKIVEVGEKENYDLIIIGSKGLSGFKRFLFGSVADCVTTESDIPVLVVK